MSFSKEFIEVFDYLADKMGVAINWTSKNIIPYLEELCMRYAKYKTVMSIGGLFVWMAFFVIGIVLVVQIYKHKEWGVDRSWSHPDKMVRFFMYSGSVMLIGMGVIGVFCYIDVIAKCVLLPELIVYEYLQTLM